MLAVLDVVNPLRDAVAGHLRWGIGHSRSLFLLGAVGVATLGPITYIFYRDWRLHRAFRQFWGRGMDSGKDAKGQSAPPVRQTLISEHRQESENKSDQAGRHTSPYIFNKPPWALGIARDQFSPCGSVAGGTAEFEHASEPSGVVHIKGKLGEGEIYLDGRFCGNTPADVELQEGKHVVEIRTKGSGVHHRELVVGPGADLTLCVFSEPGEDASRSP